MQNQTYPRWELLIIDDLSTDRSPEIVNKFAAADSRIKFQRLTKNQGPAVARNAGINTASGRYIAFLDSDDLWLPQKLETQLAFMNEHKSAFSFSDYELINENGSTMNIKRQAPPQLDYKKALLFNPVGCLTAMYDTKILGKQYFPLLKKRQDYALWLQILKTGTLGNGLQKVTAQYRIHSNSISSQKTKLIAHQWQVYHKIENLNIIKSSFYLVTSIIAKLFKINETKL